MKKNKTPTPPRLTILDFDDWIKSICRFGQVSSFVQPVSPRALDGHQRMVRIWTENYRYQIVAREPSVDGSKPGHIGCTVLARRAKAGEDWLRGSDLFDGPFSQQTWNAIMADIIGYELQPIAQTFTVSVTGSGGGGYGGGNSTGHGFPKNY